MGLFWLGCCYFPDVEVDRRGCCWEEGKVSWMLFVNRGCFDGFWRSDWVLESGCCHCVLISGEILHWFVV